MTGIENIPLEKIDGHEWVEVDADEQRMHPLKARVTIASWLGGVPIKRYFVSRPIPPEWPDGTIAWVTDRRGRRYISVRDGGRWCDSDSDSECINVLDSEVTRVEPLRVLAADEVAVKRVDDSNPAEWRNRHMCYPDDDVASLCRAYAEALEAGGES